MGNQKTFDFTTNNKLSPQKIFTLKSIQKWKHLDFTINKDAYQLAISAKLKNKLTSPKFNSNKF